MPCTPSAPADSADGWDLRERGVGLFGSEGQRWQLFVRGGLPRALALSTYCVLLTEPWCHHRPLALTTCHHVTLELMVKQWRVRTVNKDGILRLNMFLLMPVLRFLASRLHHFHSKMHTYEHIHETRQTTLQLFAIFLLLSKCLLGLWPILQHRLSGRPPQLVLEMFFKTLWFD